LAGFLDAADCGNDSINIAIPSLSVRFICWIARFDFWNLLLMSRSVNRRPRPRRSAVGLVRKTRMTTGPPFRSAEMPYHS